MRAASGSPTRRLAHLHIALDEFGDRLRGYGLENELAEGTGGYGHG
jgi:hypothetical protein